MLSIVATPIGNLQDISVRAAKTLLQCDIIACEDTRRTGVLLQVLRNEFPHLAIEKKPQFFSYYDQVEIKKLPVLMQYLQEGLHVALVSDAGTPLIADPGYKLVRACRYAHIPVETIPGPSSIIAALTVSGLPSHAFLFAGYPPQKQSHRLAFFKNIQSNQVMLAPTVIFFEAPHKLSRTLVDVQTVFGDISVTLCRELTKVHEEVEEHIISDWLQLFEQRKPRGEYVLLFSPFKK
ncbi:MAG TPA: 16S rRNA (cytidine(1402)-2'-O)-methyltransferase [Patescibacteria group bacterium]|nr:16S rRNA (cytidine(1402)-2'-O)-methyltransferase [Patescibacteria group bacterium]